MQGRAAAWGAVPLVAMRRRDAFEIGMVVVVGVVIIVVVGKVVVAAAGSGGNALDPAMRVDAILVVGGSDLRFLIVVGDAVLRAIKEGEGGPAADLVERIRRCAGVGFLVEGLGQTMCLESRPRGLARVIVVMMVILQCSVLCLVMAVGG